MKILKRGAVLLAVLLVPIALALTASSLTSPSGPPAIDEEPVRIDIAPTEPGPLPAEQPAGDDREHLPAAPPQPAEPAPAGPKEPGNDPAGDTGPIQPPVIVDGDDDDDDGDDGHDDVPDDGGADDDGPDDDGPDDDDGDD